MQRITEPELMDEAEQARAYAMADFAEPNERFVDIVLRLATHRAGLTVHGIDGSAAMLRFASESLHESPELGGRVQFIEGLLPGATLPLPTYDAVVSNSLLHHLHDPDVFWRAVREAGAPGAAVLVMDLFRPESVAAAQAIVVLRLDFLASLCAAFEPDEIRAQLQAHGLDGFSVRTVSDRHLLITGRLPPR